MATAQIDVFIPTYNSAAHLQDCISSVRRALPARRVVLLDHDSTDGTLKIAEREDCEVVREDKGLGYARQLAIDLAETEVFAMVESDLVYSQFGWYEDALKLMQGMVGAVVVYVPRSASEERGRYAEFWSRRTPLGERRHGFSAGSTLFRKEAVEGVHLPPFLNAYEDIYIMRQMRRRGWTYKTLEVAGTHHSDIQSSKKARWYGANARLLYSVDPGDVTLVRRQLALPLMGLVAAIGSRSPSVFAWSLSFSANFLLGWSDPKRFSRLKR
ncbi:MAG: glycosyltransferase [Nitrososphaerales archaeon]|nr:glycosyltransferase [Nitrososphaerales archaeon]